MRRWPERPAGSLLPWALALAAEWSYAVLWLLLGALLLGWGAAGPAVPAACALQAASLGLGLAWEAALAPRLLSGDRPRALARAALALLALAAGAGAAGLVAGAQTALLTGGALAAWYGCYQGLQLGEAGIDHGRLARRFSLQAPLLTFALLGVLWAGGGSRPAVAAAAAGTLAGYYGAALAGLALARQRDALVRQLAEGAEATAALSPGAAALLTLLVLALGLLVAGAWGGFLQSRLWPLLLALAARVLDGLLRLLWLIAYRIALLIIFLLAPLLRLLRRQPPRLEPPALHPGDLSPPSLLAGPEASLRAAAWVLVALAALVLVLLAVALGRRRGRRRLPLRPGEVRESIFTWQLLGDDLRGFLSRLFGWRRRRPRPAAAAATAAPAGAGAPPDLRAVYRSLQRFGAALGRPRRVGQTPRQYRAALAALLPAGDPHVAAITAAYERLRYGPEAPAEAEVAATRAALQALQALRAAGTTRESGEERSRIPS